MKKMLFVFLIIISVFISIPERLSALSMADIRFYNNILTFKGKPVDRLIVTAGPTLYTTNAADIIEIKIAAGRNLVTIAAKNYFFIFNESAVKAIIVDSDSNINIVL